MNLKAIGIAVVVVIVGALLYKVRAELIQKGRDYVYAEDNAALVKAQKEQMAKDAILVRDQKAYIDFIESKGETIKETIRYVKAPCDGDGVADPRLGDVVDWLRGEGASRPDQAAGGPAPQGKVPPPRLPAPKR